MSGAKIGPPGGPPRVPPGPSGDQGADPVDAPSGRRYAEVASGAAEAGAASVTPADLVRQVRDGAIDVDRAVDLLVARALDERLVASAPEALREEIREALVELTRQDPTLAALVRAMKR